MVQDVFISNMEYVLAHHDSSDSGRRLDRCRWSARRNGSGGDQVAMAEVNRYRAEDRRAVDALYRRVFGNDAADASRLRWEWQYRRNPNNPGGEPEIWIAREGPAIVGQYATMPVRLAVAGREIAGSWGMDVMVAPERQRQGLGEVLFRTWDRNVGVSLGLGLSDASLSTVPEAALARRRAGAVSGETADAARASGTRGWPTPINRLISAMTLAARPDRLESASAATPRSDSFNASTTASPSCGSRWRRSSTLAVRRDANYLNWKYATAPHVRYSIVALLQQGRTAGYAVYRHVQEPRGRVTLLADFLADPDDEHGVSTLLRWVDQEARQADSDKIRTFATNAELPPRAPPLRLLPGEVDDGVRGEGERHRRHPGFLRQYGWLARHAWRLGPGQIGHAVLGVLGCSRVLGVPVLTGAEGCWGAGAEGC